MYGSKLLNARQLIRALNIGSTTFFKIARRKNHHGQPIPAHQLSPDSRKYYVLEEVQEWLLNQFLCVTIKVRFGTLTKGD